MIPHLKGTTADGKALTRREATLKQIEEFFESGTDTLVERALSYERLSPNYVRSETLLFFLRESKNRNNQDLFDTLYAILFTRVEKIALKGADRSKPSLADEQRRDQVLDKFNELVAIDRDSYAPQLDYMECSFDQVAANWRKDASRIIRRRCGREESLSNESYHDGTNPNAIHAIKELNIEEMSPEDQVTFRLHVLPAINSLPEKQKQVIIMTAKGFKDGSQDPTETTIASVLDCDRRTVHNLRKRAFAKIREQCGIELS